MNKINKWLKEKGYKLYELKDKKSAFTIICAIKEPYILFIETKATGKKCSEEQEEFLRSVNNCGTPAGFMADSFEAFEKRMKELKLWIY